MQLDLKLLVQTGQILISLFLIGLVLVQNKGTGLSSAFGGGGEVYYTRRGAEKLVFILTIITAIVFTLSSTINVWLS